MVLTPPVRTLHAELLERAFQGVSASDRALITLYETEGWNMADLARMRGKTVQATKVRLFRT